MVAMATYPKAHSAADDVAGMVRIKSLMDTCGVEVPGYLYVVMAKAHARTRRTADIQAIWDKLVSEVWRKGWTGRGRVGVLQAV